MCIRFRIHSTGEVNAGKKAVAVRVLNKFKLGRKVVVANVERDLSAGQNRWSTAFKV